MTNINNRTLGIGFGVGFEFNLFTKEDVYKPFINRNNVDFGFHLPDLLVDLDITRLAKILPGIMAELSQANKRRFSDINVLSRLDQRFITTVAKAIPVAQRPQNPADWSRFLAEDELTVIDPFILAYLVPALLDLMGEDDLLAVSAEIVKKLDPKDFRAIKIPGYFDIQFSNVETSLAVKNNGRTLIFKPEGTEKTTAVFRGKQWELDHTHIHLERDGEEREYKFYDDRKQFKAVGNTAVDPNLKIIGEVHSVFRRVSGKSKDKLKFMAVGIPLMVGEENSQFQKILNTINKIKKIGDNALELSAKITFKDVFMQNFSSKDILYHSWASLHSSTHAFRAGLRFNISKNPMLISMKQYDVLKMLFGDIQEIDPEKALYPIDRKADHRKARRA